MTKKKDFSKATPWLSAIGLFVFWELIVRIFNIPVYVLPTPSESIIVGWEFRAAIWMHAMQTLYTTLAGFAIAVVFGVVLGALVGSSKAIYDAANPLLVGFNSVPKVVLRSLGATRTDILFKVGFPRAMPYFFASLKVAITLAFVGSVISETVASNLGVGYLMLSASSKFNMPLVFAGLLVIAVMGIAMYEMFNVIERRSTRWANRANPTN